MKFCGVSEAALNGLIYFGISAFREDFTNFRIGFVFPVSGAIGGFVGEFMFGRTQIYIFFLYVLKLPFEEQTFIWSKTPVSNYGKNFPFLQTLANRHGKIAGIQSNFLYLESKPVDLSI
jgi:hypothetical protein